MWRPTRQIEVWSSCRTKLPFPPLLRNPFLPPTPIPLLLPLFHPHRLDICELPDSPGSQLPPVARPLYPSERYPWIRSHHPIDEHHPDVQLIDELPLLGGIISPGAGTQPKPAVIRDSNRLINVLRAKHTCNRPEHLFLVSGRILGDVHQHRRRIKIPRPVQRLPPR